jgi:hypothetical protein
MEKKKMERAEIGFCIDGKRRYLVLGERVAIEPKKRILKIGKFYAIECKGSLAKELEVKLEEESKEICGNLKALAEAGEKIYQNLSDNRFYDRSFEPTSKIALKSIFSSSLVLYGGYLDYIALFSKADDATKTLFGICGGAVLGIGIGWLCFSLSDLISNLKARETKKRIEKLLEKESIKYKKVLSYNPNSLELILKY